MVEVPVGCGPDDVLQACASAGLDVTDRGRARRSPAPGVRRWHASWPDRSGTLEVTEADHGALLRVAANRDAGWASGYAQRLARRLEAEAAFAEGRVGVLEPRVLVIVHDPPIEVGRDRRLSRAMRWHDADALARQYVDDIARASHDTVRYRIVERADAAWWPAKRDGYRYTAADYLRRWKARDMYQPDAIDRQAQVRAFDLPARWDRDEIDEAWFFAFPYAGDYESGMVGRGAFWCNSPPVEGFDSCSGRFVIMGFNYERDVGCMLENFGHRVEAIMDRVWRDQTGDGNLWRRFIRYDKTHPRRSHCGNVHFAPNSERDYDWGNRRPVPSYCDAWRLGPPPATDEPGAPRIVDCSEWGGGDMRAHHVWWLAHLPHAAGSSGGVANHWWRYVIDPNLVG